MSLKYLIIVSIILVCLASCGSDDPPEGIIDEPQMAAIMMDIYLSERTFSDLNMHRDTTIMLFEKYEAVIFDRNGVTTEEYKKSLTYYYNEPKKLENIYEVMLDSLTLRESKLKARRESERSKRDAVSDSDK